MCCDAIHLQVVTALLLLYDQVFVTEDMSRRVVDPLGFLDLEKDLAASGQVPNPEHVDASLCVVSPPHGPV